MNQLQRLEASWYSAEIPHFEIGDTARVHVKVIEGEKERVQVFEGIVIARKGTRTRETFTVRKISYGVGVERIFPVHSPTIAKIEVVRKGKVRRAKLYYLRDKKGKQAKVPERDYFRGLKKKASAKVKAPVSATSDKTPQESPDTEGA